MIRPLRIYHFYVWRLLALTLVLITVFALVNRPTVMRESTLRQDFLVEVLTTEDSMYTVRLIVLNALETPTCVAYSTLDHNKTLLGLVDHRGQYNFVVSSSQSYFILTDVVHGNEILRKPLLLRR